MSTNAAFLLSTLLGSVAAYPAPSLDWNDSGRPYPPPFVRAGYADHLNDPSVILQLLLLLICAFALLCLAMLNCYECIRAHNIHNHREDFDRSIAAIVARQRKNQKESKEPQGHFYSL
uniref:Movement protein n=1 Tax=Steinernema glaseri TaxID=37863 RepID=A0A1I7ZGQ5_9BILA